MYLWHYYASTYFSFFLAGIENILWVNKILKINRILWLRHFHIHMCLGRVDGFCSEFLNSCQVTLLGLFQLSSHWEAFSGFSAFHFYFILLFPEAGLMGAQKYQLGKKNKLLSEVNAQNVYSNFTLAATFSPLTPLVSGCTTPTLPPF